MTGKGIILLAYFPPFQCSLSLVNWSMTDYGRNWPEHLGVDGD